MKKWYAIVVSFLLLVSLAGCSDEQQHLYSYEATSDVPRSQSPQGQGSPNDESAEDIASEPVAQPGVHSLPEDAAFSSGDVIEIREKLFIAQTNDMYLNPGDYLGKTIRYEGIYKSYIPETGQEEPWHYVIRYGPGCCGYDGEAGFEVRWDGEFPQEDDWVEVTGTLHEEIYPSGLKVLYLEIASLAVKQERGQEYVST